MRRGQPRFTENDLAILRVCRRNSWSIERDWDRLSEWEQNEWLAHDSYLLEAIEQAEKRLTGIDYAYTGEVFTAFLLAKL